MGKPAEIVTSFIRPLAGLCNRARLGFPGHFFQGTGGIGDDLMCTTIFRELKKRGKHSLAMATQHPGLFQNNADVDKILFHPRPRLNGILRMGLPLLRMGYSTYNPVTDGDSPLDEHVLIKLCRLAKISGPVELRPYLFLTRAEFAAGRMADNQVVIQSSGLGAPYAMRNKEWYYDRFQEVCSELGRKFSMIQIGSVNDPKLEGATDLRGKSTLRQSAALLANAHVFIGLEGFLMHLARAVDCRSVIIYGGRITPSQIGYIANQNLYTQVPCAPCWLRNSCEYQRKCMDAITTGQVIAAAAGQIGRHGTPLEVQIAQL